MEIGRQRQLRGLYAVPRGVRGIVQSICGLNVHDVYANNMPCWVLGRHGDIIMRLMRIEHVDCRGWLNCGHSLRLCVGLVEGQFEWEYRLLVVWHGRFEQPVWDRCPIGVHLRIGILEQQHICIFALRLLWFRRYL
jgi:hypothetical protein